MRKAGPWPAYLRLFGLPRHLLRPESSPLRSVSSLSPRLPLDQPGGPNRRAKEPNSKVVLRSAASPLAELLRNSCVFVVSFGAIQAADQSKTPGQRPVFLVGGGGGGGGNRTRVLRSRNRPSPSAADKRLSGAAQLPAAVPPRNQRMCP
jgi:hypothetical protein